MKYTIYKTTNKINGKFYIGKHQTNNPYDGYLGSGKAIKEAIKKYGKENFIKEVLFIFENEEEMNSKEKEIVTLEFISTDKNYNSGIGGEGGAHFKGKKHKEETKKKQSIANTGRSYNYDRYTENRKKTFFPKNNDFYKKRKKNYHTEETKEKIRQSLLKRNLNKPM